MGTNRAVVALVPVHPFAESIGSAPGALALPARFVDYGSDWKRIIN